MSLLERILASKRIEIEDLKDAEPQPATVRRGTLDVARVLKRAPGEPLRVIAEIKKKSPSAGALSTALDAEARAEAYGRAGAAMVSVLCDGPFFGGSWNDVALAREGIDRVPREIPILAKEYVLDESQLDRARVAGADAVLLIARIVPAKRLRELHEAARARDLHPLVEVANEAELASALASGAGIIGVNARDLDTLAMDAERARRVLAAIPPNLVRVHLSGIKTDDDIRTVRASAVDAVLIGETLMREADPEPRLRALVAAAAG